MSTLTQFFGGGGGGGGGTGPGYLTAKILVVGGGYTGYCGEYCFKSVPPVNVQGRYTCQQIAGAAGAVIYADTVMTPGATCPIQVGYGATYGALSYDTYSFTNGYNPTGQCCNLRYPSPEYQAGASFFGGATGYCAGAGTATTTPHPASPTAITYTPQASCRNIDCGGAVQVDRFQSGFHCSASGSFLTFQSRIPGVTQISRSASYKNNQIDFNFDKVDDLPGSPVPATTPSPSCGWQSHGFYHELLGTGQVVGGGQLGFAACKSSNPQVGTIPCVPSNIRCPTVTDALKNWTGIGTGTGSGGVPTDGTSGCPGSVIVQYPNDYDAVPAPNRPGSVDCSSNTPGFYTYYYLTPGSITLP